jgi:hypothetical protein
MTSDPNVRLRPKRAAHVVEHHGAVTAYPEPHSAPVLPAGWAPLDESAQDAVLRAADAMTEGCLRFGSVWDSSIEYRVYRLANDVWGGLCAATLFTTDRPDEDGYRGAGRNARLLAIADDLEDAARVAIDFLNWDLEAAGMTWRLSVAGS